MVFNDAIYELEIKLSGQLNDARRIRARACDLAEITTSEGSHRSAEVRLVRKIEHIRPDL
jgi:hypothetical protein